MRNIALVLIMIILLTGIIPTLQAQTITVELHVLKEDGTDASDVIVEVWNGTTRLFSGTTNTTGWVTFDITNGTATIFVKYAEGKYAIYSVDYFTSIMTLDPRLLNNMTLNTNTTIVIDAKVIAKKTTSEFILTVPSTTFTKDVLNITFPAKFKSDYGLVEYEFAKISYDTTEIATRYVELDFSTASYNVTAYYTKRYVLFLPPQYIILLGILTVVAITIILITVAKVGVKTITAVKERKYL